MVSGTPGDAGLALQLLHDPGIATVDRRLLQRLLRPTPRVALGRLLAGRASAAIDVSDGLLADLGHICAASGLGARIELERLPLSPAYDKLIDFEVADMKNTGGRAAGSITAAQFLQRFVNKVPWAHLDVAGTAMDSKRTAISQSWASGWGVRLLNRLVERHYEG